MTSPRHRFRLEIMADYFQFYLGDSEDREAPLNWSEQNTQDRVHFSGGIVVICPVRNMPVPVEISIWDSEPQVAFALWQHVVEAPLKLERDRLEVFECCGSTLASLSVPAGEYTVRALYRGLDELSDDGLEGKDFYEVQIWPGKLAALRVIKCWP